MNQVVLYNPSLFDEVTPSKTRQKLDKVAKPVNFHGSVRGGQYPTQNTPSQDNCYEHL